jgi:hypothetical protein
MRMRLVFATVVAAIAFAADGRAAPPWVDRHLTLPSGDWAFDFGLGVGFEPGQAQAGVNAEMAVGLTNRVELGVRTGLRQVEFMQNVLNGDDYGRLFDRQTLPKAAEGAEVLANPEVRVRGALVREAIVELALEGRVVLPFADGTDAGVLFGVPLSFHLGRRVRLDTGAYVPIVFVRHDTWVALNAPLDVWIQATPRLWLGPMTGLAFERVGNTGGTTDVSLGFGIGYEITHALDFKGMFLFPAINSESRFFGFGAGLQVRIE